MNLGKSSYSGNTNTESACLSNCGGNTVGLRALPMMNLGKSSYSGNTNTESACLSNCGGNTVGLNEIYATRQAETLALVQAVLAYENAMGGRHNF